MGIRMGFPGMHKLIRELNSKRKEMSQQRFKIGDTVRHKNGQHEPFIIGRYEYSIWSGKFYVGEYEKTIKFYEEDCELYQEPQKKKRFAYIATDGEVKDFTSEQDKSFNDDEGRLWRRAPDLDIDYDKLK